MFIAELETGSMKSGSSSLVFKLPSFDRQMAEGKKVEADTEVEWCIPCKWAYFLSCYSRCIRNSIFVVRTVLPASLSQIPVWKKG